MGLPAACLIPATSCLALGVAAAADAAAQTPAAMPIQKVWPRSRTAWAVAAPAPPLLRGPVTAKSQPAPFSNKLDLNRASLEQLQRLPGVGAAWAPKLLAGRPYRTLGDLARDGIPFNTIDQITPLVELGP
jgi:competence protein ComEA